MKKIFIGLAALALASCSYYMKGDYILGKRNTFNDFFYTYNIRYYDNGVVANTIGETEVVSDFSIGDELHAGPGGEVVSAKTVVRQVRNDEFVRPTKKGALVSYTVPVEFSDEKLYRIIGEADIDGRIYRLVEPNRLKDIILLDDYGNIYPRVGRIFNDRLALLRTEFQLEPEGVTFQHETAQASDEDDDNLVSSYELRYAGIENNQMVFKYKTVSAEGGSLTEENKTLRFPMYDKTVAIGSLQIDVIRADGNGIDYRILTL